MVAKIAGTVVYQLARFDVSKEFSSMLSRLHFFCSFAYRAASFLFTASFFTAGALEYLQTQ
jgi:hypothetical protein